MFRKTKLSTVFALLTVLMLTLNFIGCDDSSSSSDPKTYTVTITPSSNGTISASPQSAAEGDTVTLTISSSSGYRLKAGSLIVKDSKNKDVSVSGAGNKYSFSMPASNVTVSGEFEEGVTYTVTVSVPGGNGTINAEPSSEVVEGNTIVINIHANDGYSLKAGSLTVKDASNAAITFNDESSTRKTFVMPASNVTVSGEFELMVEPVINHITIDPAIANGTVTVDHILDVLEGTLVGITYHADPGYRIVDGSLSVKETGGSRTITITAGTSDHHNGSGTFTMPAFGVTITAAFEIDPVYTITKDATTNGSVYVLPATLKGVEDDIVRMVVSPDSGYKLKTLSVTKAGGGTVEVTKNTFKMPAGNVTISAEFETVAAGEYTISVDIDVDSEHNVIQHGFVYVNATNSARADDEIAIEVYPDSGWEAFVYYTKFDDPGTKTYIGFDEDWVAHDPFTMPVYHVIIHTHYERLPQDTITVSFNDFVDETIGLDLGDNFDIYPGYTATVSIINLNGASINNVYVDGSLYTDRGTNYINLYGTNLIAGRHTLTIEFIKGGVYYSKALYFRVVK